MTTVELLNALEKKVADGEAKSKQIADATKLVEGYQKEYNLIETEVNKMKSELTDKIGGLLNNSNRLRMAR